MRLDGWIFMSPTATSTVVSAPCLNRSHVCCGAEGDGFGGEFIHTSCGRHLHIRDSKKTVWYRITTRHLVPEYREFIATEWANKNRDLPLSNPICPACQQALLKAHKEGQW